MSPHDISEYFINKNGSDGFTVKDIDSDGNDEVFVFDFDHPTNYIQLVDQDLNPIHQEMLPERDYSSVFSWVDTDGDGILELGIPYKIPDSVVIQFYAVIENYMRPSARIAFPQGSSADYPGYWDGFYKAIGMIGTNDDGQDEILFHVHTNYNYQPRALFAYDPINKETVWKYNFGTAIGYFDIGDFNSDGFDEIIMGSHAFTNGPREGVNGTDDYHSYLIMLDRKGDLIFQKKLGGKYSWCSVVGFEGYDRFSGMLYAAITPSAPDEADSSIQLGRVISIDPIKSDIIREIVLGNQSFAFQRMQDPLNETTRLSGIITDGNDGYLRVYNQNLDLKYQSTKYVGMSFRTLLDIDNNGYVESMIITEDNHLRMLDNFMVEFAEYNVTDEKINYSAILKRQKFEDCRIITQTTNTMVFRIPEVPNVQMAKIYVWVSSNNWRVILAYIGSLLLLIIIGIIRAGLLKNAVSLQVNEYGVSSTSGIIGINDNNRVLYANKIAQNNLALPDRWRWKSIISIFGLKEGNKFTRLLDQLKLSGADTRQSLPLITPKGLKIAGFQIAGDMSSFREHIRFYIVDAADPLETEEMLLGWFDLSSSLMHGIKSPMTHILRSVELTRELLQDMDDERGDTVEKELDNAVLYIRQSIDIADRFLQFRLRQVSKNNYVTRDIIQETVDYTMVPLGIPVDCKVEVDDAYLKLYTDHEIFRQLLSILIHNAVDAVNADNGEIIIHCKSAQNMRTALPADMDNDYDAIVVVEDNGKGIPEEILHRVFEPLYTTKAEKGGHGLGLAIARKLCNMLNAQISIQSTMGKGTAVFIGLRKDKE